MKKKIFIGLLVLLSFFVSGVYAQEEEAPVVTQENMVNASERDPVSVLGQLFEFYQKAELEKLENMIADSFFPSKRELMKEIKIQLEENTLVDFDYSVKKHELLGDSLRIECKWKKSLRDNINAKVSKSKGKVQLYFRNVTEGWMLFSLKGDNPFE